MKAVMDTNVFVCALRSNRGASAEVLRQLRAGRWTLVLSNHLLHEYEELAKRQAADLGLTLADVDDVLDALCLAAHQQRLSHGWKPVLTDPDDEPLVQLATEGGAGAIVTYNVRHLQPAAEFGILVLTPKEFLTELRRNK